MEIHLTPEQEAQLSAIANHAGTDPEQIVREAIDRIIQDDAHFRAAVRKRFGVRRAGSFASIMTRSSPGLNGSFNRDARPLDD